MKNVIIKIKGTQGLGKDKDVIELTTEGTYEKSEKGFILHYEEGEMMGERAVHTTLTAIGQDSVVLERSGDMSSRLVIERHKRNTCFYSIPQGEMVLGIYGKAVQNRLTDSGGTLKMEYTIDTNLQPVSENTVEISVKEVKQ